MVTIDDAIARLHGSQKITRADLRIASIKTLEDLAMAAAADIDDGHDSRESLEAVFDEIERRAVVVGLMKFHGG